MGTRTNLDGCVVQPLSKLGPQGAAKLRSGGEPTVPLHDAWSGLETSKRFTANIKRYKYRKTRRTGGARSKCLLDQSVPLTWPRQQSPCPALPRASVVRRTDEEAAWGLVRFSATQPSARWLVAILPRFSLGNRFMSLILLAENLISLLPQLSKALGDLLCGRRRFAGCGGGWRKDSAGEQVHRDDEGENWVPVIHQRGRRGGRGS